MNISQMNKVIENKNDDFAVDFIKFKLENSINWIDLNCSVVFLNNAECFIPSKKYKLIGSWKNSNKLIIFSDSKNNNVSIQYSILKEFKEKNLIKVVLKNEEC